jgi:hypothetical protein
MPIYGSYTGSLIESYLPVQNPGRLLLVSSIKENEPFMNTADAHNLIYHERIIPEEVIHFFLVESFNDNEETCIVCKRSPRVTVPSSKSFSINAACSVQHGCSRLVFPAIQLGPGEKKVAKVFFMDFLSVLCILVYFTQTIIQSLLLRRVELSVLAHSSS